MAAAVDFENVAQSVKAGVNSRKLRLLLNVSTIFASSGPDFAEAARSKFIELRDESNLYR